VGRAGITRLAAACAAATFAVAGISVPAVRAATLPTISVGSGAVVEGDAGTRTLTFGVTLSAPATGTVSVHYAVVPATETATSGAKSQDFKAKSGILSFALNRKGTTPVQKNVTVTVYGDRLVEPDESFAMVLSNPSGPATLRQAIETGRILDDDSGSAGGLTASVGDMTIQQGAAGAARKGSVPVTLSDTPSATVTVGYQVTPGTATPGRDYTAKSSGTLTFLKGAREHFIPVQALDTPVDGSESLQVRLTTATVPVDRGVGTVTITDDPYLGATGTAKVAAIGDSILFVAEGYVDFVDADAYRTWAVGIPGYTIGNALPALRGEMATSPSAVIVELGTDDALEANDQWRDAWTSLLSTIAPAPCVGFVNLDAGDVDYLAARSAGRAVTVADDVNRAITAQVGSASQREGVIDWQGAVAKDPSLLADGLHPSDAGKLWLAQHIRSFLDTTCAQKG
jgi:hypothetical protein